MDRDDLLVIVNALAEPFLLVDEKRRITLANTAADSFFGKDLTGQDFVRAIRNPKALACIDAALAGAAKVEAVVTFPGRIRATHKIRAAHLDEARDLQASAAVSLHDISHVLEAEQMRSDFVANVSHELRSPLVALIGGIETLKGAARNDAAARMRFLDIMEREAARMNRLIADLLSLSGVEVNERVRPSGQVNVLKVVERAVAALETQSAAERKPIRLERADGDIDVLGDEDELTQVFHNLIDNALKYSREDGEITVSFATNQRVVGMSSRALKVEVRDQGEGIPGEHIPRLTERFFRVDNSRSREKGGTGLGLAIVKHILNRHRGRLTIESKRGVGSTFTACLPLDPGAN